MALLPPLVDVDTLAAHVDHPSLRIFDTTVHLRRPAPGTPYVPESGRSDYADGHIPGAAFADLIAELADPGAPFPFALPDAARFASAAGGLGIGPGRHVVAYSQTGPMWATRLWWLLRHFGFDRVSVLDGGLEAWRNKGHEMNGDPASYPPAHFEAHARPGWLARRHDVELVVASGQSAPDDGSEPLRTVPAQLVNALSPDAFSGLTPGAYGRPGRIPGSINVPYADLLDQTGCFLPLDEIGVRFERAGIDGRAPIVAYCGGGISATVDVFALDLLGHPSRLYDGSLSECAADPSLPLETDRPGDR